MSQVELVVTFRCRTLLARAWVRVMAFVAPVIGRARAVDWAVAGAKRLISVRVLHAHAARQFAAGARDASAAAKQLGGGA